MQIFFFTLEEKWEEKRFVYVEVGLNLGDTAVYDLLLTIVGSLTDAAPLQTWLEETWIPSVTQE